MLEAPRLSSAPRAPRGGIRRLSRPESRRGNSDRREAPGWAQACDEVLTRAAEPWRAEMLADIDRIRAMTPKDKPQLDSTDLIREERDRGLP